MFEKIKNLLKKSNIAKIFFCFELERFERISKTKAMACDVIDLVHHVFSYGKFINHSFQDTSNGFNRVRTERPHQAPLKYIKKWSPYTRNRSISS